MNDSMFWLESSKSFQDIKGWLGKGVRSFFFFFQAVVYRWTSWPKNVETFSLHSISRFSANRFRLGNTERATKLNLSPAGAEYVWIFIPERWLRVLLDFVCRLVLPWWCSVSSVFRETHCDEDINPRLPRSRAYALFECYEQLQLHLKYKI